MSLRITEPKFCIWIFFQLISLFKVKRYKKKMINILPMCHNTIAYQ